MRQNRESVRERNESLWLLTAAPLIWAVHFLLSYVSAAVWCAKFVERGGTLAPVREAIVWFTVVGLVGIALVGWSGYRRHTYGSAAVPHDFDTPEDRHRFLGFATLLLAGLSAVATIYTALATVFIGNCQ